ncbi:heat-shock protein Hsp70 [Plantactinospora sp. BC1]|uniref:Hsp70 family protein n=1 Tax=Plantactinospora sp. BC1 TaxID=2108470 RepID=UPI000D173418|nr:Hsp70 family protein [Plantactinospora sp. BC1]AVT28189.1 heat-shock protein Hsp70 [Plantactinospora sp. BC1]
MLTTPAALGVDFGTSHTVAAVRMPSGRTESLLFDASPLLPSAVFAQSTGQLLVGHDALRGSRLDPGRSEPNPKRHIADGTLLLGDVETTVEEAVRAVLSRVAQTARRALGTTPTSVVLTHPASWGAQRRGVLARAAAGAGLGGAVRLLAEPVAAAFYFTEVLGHRVEPGGTLVVYDLGGGTFDISAVRRLPDGGWEVRATAGLDDVGGVDIDAAIVQWMVTHAGADETGARLGLSEARRWQQAQQEARAAKEQLSRFVTAPIVLPGLDREFHLTRTEFDELARPLLERTVVLTTSTLFGSGVTADRLAGVFLVGGSSRIPLVATMLHRALGVAPTVIDQPELVVAHGSLHAPPSGGPTPVDPAPPVRTHPAQALTPPPPPPTPTPPTPPTATTPTTPPPTPTTPSTPPTPTAAPTMAAGPVAQRSIPGEPAPAPRPAAVTFAVAVLLGAVVGAAMTAYPMLAGYDGPLPYWTDRYAWQLIPLAGLLAGIWARRRGVAFVAQVVSGVVAGLVGLVVVQTGRDIFRLPWGIPVEFYFWEHHPDIWFLTLVGGCLGTGLVLEAALAATARLGNRGLAVAAVAAAGMLPSLLLLWIFDWEYQPQSSRLVVDTLFAYPFVLLLAWPAAALAGRPSR